MPMVCKNVCFFGTKTMHTIHGIGNRIWNNSLNTGPTTVGVQTYPVIYLCTHLRMFYPNRMHHLRSQAGCSNKQLDDDCHCSVLSLGFFL